jgi:hypothetical protein
MLLPFPFQMELVVEMAALIPPDCGSWIPGQSRMPHQLTRYSVG